MTMMTLQRRKRRIGCLLLLLLTISLPVGQSLATRNQSYHNLETKTGNPTACRRHVLSSVVATVCSTLICHPAQVFARSPGSTDVTEAVQQIKDAAIDLQKLQRDFFQYAVVDDEGRAVTDATVRARRILGGVAPLAGTSAIEVAKVTPLYRIDGAFTVIRRACLEDVGDWSDKLDLVGFEEIADRIQFALQKADGDFYSVQFAAKGTKQISGIYKEAKEQVDQGVIDFDLMVSVLKEAGTPGI